METMGWVPGGQKLNMYPFEENTGYGLGICWNLLGVRAKKALDCRFNGYSLGSSLN